MTPHDFTARLLELKREFEHSMQDIPAKLRREVAAFNNYAPEAQAREVRALQTVYQANVQGKIGGVLRDIASAGQDAAKQRARLMFPALTAEDVASRTLGEMQLQGSRAFLATNPDPAAIGNEARDSLTLGRTDAAWTLIQHMKDAVPQGRPTNEAEREMAAALEATLEAVDGIQKIAALEKDIASLPTVERIAQEFQTQVSQGKESLVSPELFQVMTHEEQAAMLKEVEQSGDLLTRVSLKRRMAEREEALPN